MCPDFLQPFKIKDMFLQFLVNKIGIYLCMLSCFDVFLSIQKPYWYFVVLLLHDNLDKLFYFILS